MATEVAKVGKAQTALIPSDPLPLEEVEEKKMDFLAKIGGKKGHSGEVTDTFRQ